MQFKRVSPVAEIYQPSAGGSCWRTTCIGEMEPFLERLQRMGFRPRNILDVRCPSGSLEPSGTGKLSGCALYVDRAARGNVPLSLKDFAPRPKGIEWKLAAAGPKPGEMVLNVWQDHLAGSSLLLLVDTDAVLEQRRVPVVTIDSLYPESGPLPDFVKLDVQGFELAALAGASRLFGHTNCFVMEVSFNSRLHLIGRLWRM